MPFGTRMYLRQNAANRSAPVALGRHGSADGSTAFFGPACKFKLLLGNFKLVNCPCVIPHCHAKEQILLILRRS